jgi:hypothetical protein
MGFADIPEWVWWLALLFACLSAAFHIWFSPYRKKLKEDKQ